MSGHLDKLSWGDLRIVTAIGEGGSLVASAATLGLNHSTVSRRLAALELGLGVALFECHYRRQPDFIEGREPHSASLTLPGASTGPQCWPTPPRVSACRQ
ncbi:helix-turn-helix domain-containing protein [Pseudomonas aeruginosa]|uniref:helix-turn-helix domain-containing protein n=1 Tax=Pseudomonas aeruginosa TaxID=287 RepID=UPI00071B4D6B|nr:LysR family transcriptional regulator [Pseudomonas aeruginosa]KSR38164.1 LysR family transcriptional regulator [Pseudomonas aeruginosa]RPV08133.1 LysR family transcriptional regulator [Pseudomonas aeruginosa]